MRKNNIAQLRKKAGMNQKDLGDRLKVAQTTISGWEVGKSEPDISQIDKMASIFGVTIGFLMGYEEENGTVDTSILKNPNAFQTYLDNRNIEECRDPDDIAAEQIAEMDEKLHREFALEQLQGKWLLSKLPIYFESYYINKAFDHMIKSERKRLLEIVKLAFPNAFELVFGED